MDGPHDQLAGLQSATTQSHPTPSSHEQNGRHRPQATSAADLQPASCRGPVPASNRRVQRNKNGNWTNAQLEKALSAITDDGLKIREAARLYNTPATSLRNHLWGTTMGNTEVYAQP